MKPNLLDFTIEELKEKLSALNEKSYRAGQIYSAINLGKSIADISEISKDLREKLALEYEQFPVTIIEALKSVDGTIKFLFKLCDNNIIEGVLMSYKYGYTLCVSTQVGCRMKCAFCASGLNGLIRNLSAGEILGEVVCANAYLGGGLKDKRKIINIVLMGSGEPLDNYDNVVKFLRLVSCKDGLNISPRNISLSTSGLVPNIYKLAEENLPVNLTISLHSPNDEEREKIMPVAKTYKIKDILDACANYFDKTGRRYIFEYVLIRGENDDMPHAESLIKLLKGRPCHVNLIRLNEVKENNLKGGTEKQAYVFMGALIKGGLSATVRRKMGEDIEGACGQLRRKYIEENNIKG